MIYLSDMPSSSSPVGPILRLCGTCGHEVDVRLGADDDDVRRIDEALERGESTALLRRFCPYCMDDSEFPYPIEPVEPPRVTFTHSRLDTSPSNVASSSFQIMTTDLVPPPERAYRLWEKARARMKTDATHVERDLRQAITLFRREDMIQERLGAMEDLSKFFEAQGDQSAAAKVRAQIKTALD